MVKIKLLSYFKSIGGFEVKEFEISEKKMVKDLVKLKDIPEDRIVVLINSKAGNLDTFVTNEDEIVLSPVFGGGLINLE